MVLPLSKETTSWASEGTVKSTHAPDEPAIIRTVNVPKSAWSLRSLQARVSWSRRLLSRTCSAFALTLLVRPLIQSERIETLAEGPDMGCRVAL